MRLGHGLMGGLGGLLSAAAFACAVNTDIPPDGEARETDNDSVAEEGKGDTGGGGKNDRGASDPEVEDREQPTIGGFDQEMDDNVCDQISIQARPNAPDVLIVLDRSSSMVGQGANDKWNPSVAAVKSLTQELHEGVNFGLMLFPAPGARAGVAQGILGGLGLGAINTLLPEDTGCAPGKVVVPLKLENAGPISEALDRGGPAGLAYTPTAASLEIALESLTNVCADCAERPAYVLLVTDGEPTCTTGTSMGSQADVDATNAAIDKLMAADIKTYVVGYGTAANPAAAAAMTSFAEHGGTGEYIPVENGDQLSTELRSIAGSLVSCEYELNQDVEDPQLVRVVIDGETLILNQGWRLEGRKVILEGACDKIKDARVHSVQIKKDCVPEIWH